MEQRRTLWTLYAVNFLNSIGSWFFLPLLPIFIGRRGGSAALVGAVFAAGLVSSALIRYPAGAAADRYGTRVVLIAAMVSTGALFLAYLLPLPLPAFVVLRLVHGAAQGAFFPAANSLLAEATEDSRRGKAFGYMQATNMAGMLIGPGVGGFIALFNLGVVFAVAAALSAFTMPALATLPNVRSRAKKQAPRARAGSIAVMLLPLILLGAGTSFMGGAFDTIWSLYMTYRGASTFAVGISFVTFALPATLLSGFAGSLGDRFGPRRFIVGGLLATAVFAGIYPFVTSVPWLIGLGLVEGAFTISGVPSVMAEVSRAAEPGQYGRTQAVYQTAQTGAMIAGALVAGALFTLAPIYAFFSIAAVCTLGAATAFVPRAAFRRTVEQT